MGQTLTHGVYLPDEGERNCYSGLAANWQILDSSVGTIAAHTAALSGKAPLVHTHTKSDVTDLLNSSFIPSANNSYNLGSSSYQWNNLYAKNYFYNGVAWGLDKANEWTENNIFSKRSDPASITSIADTTLAFNGLFNTIFLNTRGSSNRRSYGSFLFVGYGSASGVDNYGQIQLLRSTDKRGDTNEGYVPDTSFKLWRVAPQSLIMDSMEAVRVTNDGTENSLKPITNNATDLGTSTNKWKTLNGVNPGALSLPDISRVTNIDTTGWVFDGSTVNEIKINNAVQTLNGWLYIRLANASNTDSVGVRYNGSGKSNMAFAAPFVPGSSHMTLSCPIVAGVSANVWATKQPEYIKFYLSLGEVNNFPS